MTDDEIIQKAAAGEEITVLMSPFVTQSAIDRRREELHRAALRQLAPIEIITRPRGFIVRRFK